MRIVTKASSDEIINILRTHLDSLGFNDVDIEIFSSFDYCHTSSIDPIVNTIENTLNYLKADKCPSILVFNKIDMIKSVNSSMKVI